PRSRADVFGKRGQKGDDVVVDFILDFADALDAEGRFPADIVELAFGYFSLAGPVFAGRDLDIAPDFELALQRPQPADFWGGVAVDHELPPLAPSLEKRGEIRSSPFSL